ncbi:MAG TPA: SRPBCC family protein [Candidatus Limnocylindrales bacterium]|nr:SRPBCC family protein [Candidatus Limnocylindrales bacterium]
MRRVEAAALVGASRDEVWDLYDDIAGTSRWVPAVREILYVSGPARVGTIYRERTRVMLIPDTAQWEVTEHRRPVRQVHVCEGGTLERARVITFEARGSGTWVRQTTEIRSALWGPLGFLHELLAVFPAGWTVRSAVAGAKRAFEGDPRR